MQIFHIREIAKYMLLHIKNIKYIFTKPTCICGIIDRDPERESQ